MALVVSVLFLAPFLPLEEAAVVVVIQVMALLRPALQVVLVAAVLGLITVHLLAVKEFLVKEILAALVTKLMV
jgi:hypothetical protein